jgi:hypothetical protein
LASCSRIRILRADKRHMGNGRGRKKTVRQGHEEGRACCSQYHVRSPTTLKLSRCVMPRFCGGVTHVAAAISRMPTPFVTPQAMCGEYFWKVSRAHLPLLAIARDARLTLLLCIGAWRRKSPRNLQPAQRHRSALFTTGCHNPRPDLPGATCRRYMQ